VTREDATEWLKVVHDNVRDLYIRNDLFWQFQEVIREHERLADAQNVFLYWMNSLFSEAIVMAVRREIDRHKDCISLRHLLEELKAAAELTAGRLEPADIQADIDDLIAQTRIVQGYADRRVAHTDSQGLQDGSPTYRDVRKCIDRLCALTNKYAAAMSNEDLSILPPACGTRWKEIFTFPWIENTQRLE
jgi:hypothetical protein